MDCAEKLALKAYYLSRCQHFDTSFSLYYQSNENLLRLFQEFDVSNKDVFTTLASSDQALSCYYHHAKSIDVFDKVYPALYYYYLRKWCICCYHTLYPPISLFKRGSFDLYQLIDSILPTSSYENEAKKFWLIYFQYTGFKSDEFLFHIDCQYYPKPFSSWDSIKHFFDNEIHFSYLDFFQPIPINKQYDILILSNILEYASSYEDFLQARNNIEKLLHDGGRAICSYQIYSHDDDKHIKEIQILTSHLLSVEKMSHAYYDTRLGRNVDLAYCYQLKR